jgi:Ca2+-transporting ATPase
VDAYIVLVLVITNISIGFYLEYSAQKKSDSIKGLLTTKALVIRESKQVLIDSSGLLPGDIVLIKEGDSVPADLRILKSSNLMIDESSLTGESLPVRKETKNLPTSTVLAERSNMAYLGTSVISGDAIGVVIAIGDHTELGKISSSLESIEEEKTLFHIRTERLMKQMVIISLITSSLSVVILITRDTEWLEVFQFSVATLVSGIPEGLPSVLTVLLSIASVRMSRRKALLKNLPSIESLSSVDTIVTDKTGTITQNIMSINQLKFTDNLVDIEDGDFSETLDIETTCKESKTVIDEMTFLLELLALSSNCDVVKENGAFKGIGSPTELARYRLPFRAKIRRDILSDKYEILDHIPYDQATKYSTYIIKNLLTKVNYLIVVGGAERVLALSQKVNDVEAYIKDQALLGFRMQSLSYKQISNTQIINDDLHNLKHLATLRISDPIRKDVADIIPKTNSAGIRVIMATGDNKETAYSIAKQANIIQVSDDQTDIDEFVITEDIIDTMSDEEFKKAVQKYNVFARVTPSTKLRLSQVLQESGAIVAMTGDGVNDAPALKNASIGVSMGLNGTDVARESSDLILLDDSFATIYEAIKEGRTVFANVRKTSMYLVTTNLAEDILVITTLLLGMPLPLLPIQILWLNLVTDGLNDVALATEVSSPSIMQESPLPQESNILRRKDVSLILAMGILMASLSIGTFFYFRDYGMEYARTMVFVVMVFSQLFNVLNLRSFNMSIFSIGVFTNKALNITIPISIVLLLLTIVFGPLSNILDTVQVEPNHFIFAFLLSLSVLVAGEVYKLIKA